ncbi:hypothetical protein CHS0354_018510 [Potamilus streckersoni]|uniref:GDP-mannose 4,6-dehydratase n=1 Tax=Potamilus streckersoni TaxID=2493646 RepID=A0AAE0WAB2_9BIVA|nr:hypothetical protein CHS0354_018510 [Potamilus streckersoni]
MSHVKVSFEIPEYSANADGIGTLRILEAVRLLGLEKKTRIYQASTSELYGKVQETPQSETTPFYPRSPYAVAKLYAYWITVNYREAYGMYACSGILFNHESPLRGETFVTRKITRSIGAMLTGREECLYLGNLNAKRDWGHAKDYVDAMWRILQLPEPEDFVIATGETTSVRDFVRIAFEVLGIEIEFRGDNEHETGYVKTCSNPDYQLPIGKTVVKVDPAYYRPTEVDLLMGNAAKARQKLNWTPTYNVRQLAEEMVLADIKLNKQKNMAEGHRGLVGSAIKRCLETAGYTQIIGRTHAELDLSSQSAVTDFFNKAKPEYVFLAAAKVGVSWQIIRDAQNLYMKI